VSSLRERAPTWTPHSSGRLTLVLVRYSKGLITKVETQFKLHWLEGYFIAGARASDFAAKGRGMHVATPTVEPTKDQPFRLILYPSTVNVDPGSVAFPGGTIDLHPLPAVSHAAGYVQRAQTSI